MTFFMIVAIALLMLFAIIYFISVKTKTVRRTEMLDVLDVRNYMEACVRNVLNDGIELLSKQGGYIYKYQNGSTECCPIKIIVEDPQTGRQREFTLETVEYSDSRGEYNVSFSLYAPYIPNPVNLYPSPPNYLGYVIAPMLKKTLKPGFLSVQDQLKYYLNNSVGVCLKQAQDVFNSTYDFIVSEGTPVLNVSVFLNRIDAVLNLPVVVGRGGEVKTLKRFGVTSDVRLGLVYSLLFELNPDVTDRPVMRRDASEADFDITKPEVFEGVGIEGISVGRYDASTYDVIVVEDNRHILNGQNYRFYTARENRPPVVAPYQVQEYGVDYFVTAGDTIDIKTLAVDPDEDNITVKINGWGADYCNVEPMHLELCGQPYLDYVGFMYFTEGDEYEPRPQSCKSGFENIADITDGYVGSDDVQLLCVNKSYKDDVGLTSRDPSTKPSCPPGCEEAGEVSNKNCDYAHSYCNRLLCIKSSSPIAGKVKITEPSKHEDKPECPDGFRAYSYIKDCGAGICHGDQTLCLGQIELMAPASGWVKDENGYHYETKNEDAIKSEIFINATDPAGTSDWSMLSIIVNDVPEPMIIPVYNDKCRYDYKLKDNSFFLQLDAGDRIPQLPPGGVEPYTQEGYKMDISCTAGNTAGNVEVVVQPPPPYSRSSKIVQLQFKKNGVVISDAEIDNLRCELDVTDPYGARESSGFQIDKICAANCGDQCSIEFGFEETEVSIPGVYNCEGECIP